MKKTNTLLLIISLMFAIFLAVCMQTDTPAATAVANDNQVEEVEGAAASVFE